MTHLEKLKRRRDRAYENMKIVYAARAAIVKAIFNSAPNITYEKATDVAETIDILLFNDYIELDRQIDTASKIEAELNEEAEK